MISVPCRLSCLRLAGRGLTTVLSLLGTTPTWSEPARSCPVAGGVPEAREYEDATDHIRKVLVNGHYMSLKDIEICARFEVKSRQDRADFPQIEVLHATLAKPTETIWRQPHECRHCA